MNAYKQFRRASVNPVVASHALVSFDKFVKDDSDVASIVDVVDEVESVLGISSGVSKLGLSLSSPPEQVRNVSKLKAQKCVSLYSCGMSHRGVLSFVRDLGVPVPVSTVEKFAKNRLCCADWWYRIIFKTIARCREDLARDFGLVNRANDVYISKDSMKRIQARWDRSEQVMKELIAVCQETGEELQMGDVLAASMANPKNKLAELLVRVRGFEDYAKEKQHKAVFYTLTTPSKFHAFSPDGLKNPKYLETKTARDGQEYMVKVWSQVRAKLDRMGVEYYGFRVVEPHHDGTPHWHMLLFMPDRVERDLTAVIDEYFKREDNKELFSRYGFPLQNKQKARVDAKQIDMEKGSAVGYLIKYIAKNIGCLMGADTDDYETGKHADESAPLVRGWASLYGIRQFQQIGGASVTAWRELRRLREIEDDSGLAFKLWSAADKGDWCGYSKLLGGCEAKRKTQPISLQKTSYLDINTGEIRQSRYGELYENVIGVAVGYMCQVDFKVLETKVKTWVIGRVNEVFENRTPWTRVNNCTVDQERADFPERELIPDTSAYTDYLEWEPITDDEPDFDDVPIMESPPYTENIPDYENLVPFEDDSNDSYSEYMELAW